MATQTLHHRSIDPPRAEDDGRSPIQRLIGNRNFRLLWLGEAISLLGDQFYLIALPWLALQLTGDPLVMGGALAVGALPRALFMLVGGAATDRFSARSVMLAANLGRMSLVGLLAALVLAGLADIWMLYVFALLFGLADAFFFPAQSAIVPYLVDKASLQTANAIVQGTAQLSLFAGPALAGIVIALLSGGQTADGDPDVAGIGVAFAFDALTFLASALTLWRMAVPGDNEPEAQHESSGVGASIREGLAAVWNDSLLRSMFFMIGVANVLVNAPLLIGIPALADTKLPEGAAAFGILLSAYGGGSLFGTLLAGALPRPRKNLGTRLLLVWSVMGVSVAALGFVTETYQGALVTAIAGVASGYVVIIFITWLQARTPEAMLGRMMSVLMFTLVGLAPAANVIAGALVSIDLRVYFVGSGGLMTLIVLAHLVNPEIRAMGAGHDPAVTTKQSQNGE